MSRTGQGWAAVPTDDATPLATSRSAKSAQPAAASAAANPASYAGPKTRQRIHKPPEPLAVPDIDEDAAERKRVLNVLAQRRYRKYPAFPPPTSFTIVVQPANIIQENGGARKRRPRLAVQSSLLKLSLATQKWPTRR